MKNVLNADKGNNIKFYVYLVFFLIINFGGLWAGTFFMNDGPQSSWYLNLEKAPWMPPGWVFGAAWFTIMLCFSIYMALLVGRKSLKKVLPLFAIHFLLNVGWNYIFFNQHLIGLGMLNLIVLSLLILFFIVFFHKVMKKYTMLLFPYILWLFIANSLNAYILFNN